MSIRTRLAIVLGGVTMVAVVVIAGLTWWLAATNVRTSIDDLLSDQAATARAVVRAAESGPLELPPRSDDALAERTFLIQVVLPDGSVIGDTGLPIDESVGAAVRNDDESFRTVDLDDRQYRVLSFSEDDALVQLATDVTSVEDGLRRLRTGVRLVGLIGAAAAAVIGWLIAHRLTRPIVDVTAAASQLAHDTALPTPIRSNRSDEVGALAESFNDLLEALETSRVQQSRLVGDASHELRTPLTSLRLKIDFLRSQPDLDPDARERIVEGAATELEALSALVSELVDLAAGATTDEPAERVDLGDIVEESARRARLTTGRTITTSTEHVTVTAHPAAVRRALSNLIGNAHKYTPDGTPIEIHEFGGGIEVRDHGSGISTADRQRAFDRFYRSNATQDRPGSGIGLAIVKQTADLHGGDVWIDDGADGGAVVGFSIPMSSPLTASPPSAPAAPSID